MCGVCTPPCPTARAAGTVLAPGPCLHLRAELALETQEGLRGGSPEGTGGVGSPWGRAPGLVQWVWGHLKRVSVWYPEENQHVAGGHVCRPLGLLEDLGSQGASLGRVWEPGEAQVQSGEWAAAAVMLSLLGPSSLSTDIQPGTLSSQMSATQNSQRTLTSQWEENPSNTFSQEDTQTCRCPASRLSADRDSCTRADP